MYEQFTPNALNAMRSAGAEARRLNRKHIDAEEVLIGLLLGGSSVAACVLRNIGIDLLRLRQAVEPGLHARPDTGFSQFCSLTRRGKRAVENGMEKSERLDQRYVGTEHLLLGLLQSPDRLLAEVFATVDLTSDSVRREMVRLAESTSSQTVPSVSVMPSVGLRLSALEKTLMERNE